MQALEGLKVVEVGNIIAGPFCSTLMADFGARVIKVEQPGTGDLIRNMGRIKDMWYCVEARNKMNITLNLKTARGKELLKDLLQNADILVENFRPGVFAKLGFSWGELQRINPKLIYVCASGFGQTGPKAHRPGMDRIGLAAGGLLQVTGYPDRAPVKPGIACADFYTGMFACIGAMFAIYNRDIIGTGKGQKIDCCLAESILRIQESILAEYSYDGHIRERIGNAAEITVPSGHFQTKDKQYLIITMSGDKLFNACMQAIHREDIAAKEEYRGQLNRTAHRDELNKILGDWIAEHTIDECLSTLENIVPCHKVYNAQDIVNDQHFNDRNDIVELDTEEFGKIKMQNVVPKMSGTPGKVNWEGKNIGYFNKKVFCDILGLPVKELENLKDTGVI